MRSRSPFRWLACLLAALTLPGCSSWRETPLAEPAPAAARDAKARALKLRTRDGEKLTLHAWTLEGDTLRGTREVWGKITVHERPAAFAVRDVRLEDVDLADNDLAGMLASPLMAQEVRVHFRDGRWIALESPRVDGDSLRGFARARGGGLRAMAFARTDVRAIETRQFSGGKTVVLFGGLMAAGALGILLFYALAVGRFSD